LPKRNPRVRETFGKNQRFSDLHCSSLSSTPENI